MAEADWGLPARIEQCLQRFSLDMPAEQSLVSLSGGQGTRARLAALVFQKPDFILLDEPTNNLDLAAQEALEAALQSYEGALLVVSHDERFLDAIGVDRTLVLM